MHKTWKVGTALQTLKNLHCSCLIIKVTSTSHSLHELDSTQWLHLFYSQEKDTEDLTVSSIFGGAKASQEADNILIIQDKRLTSPKGRKYIQVRRASTSLTSTLTAYLNP